MSIWTKEQVEQIRSQYSNGGSKVEVLLPHFLLFSPYGPQPNDYKAHNSEPASGTVKCDSVHWAQYALSLEETNPNDKILI